ncbi:hypothetical protein, partial [Phocaeicola sp.]|uniref:hypothetical protein n=1 Tax=Phocaeicola sp. TaxID=2773926 RepID=UPI003AB8748F
FVQKIFVFVQKLQGFWRAVSISVGKSSDELPHKCVKGGEYIVLYMLICLLKALLTVPFSIGLLT